MKMQQWLWLTVTEGYSASRDHKEVLSGPLGKAFLEGESDFFFFFFFSHISKTTNEMKCKHFKTDNLSGDLNGNVNFHCLESIQPLAKKQSLEKHLAQHSAPRQDQPSQNLAGGACGPWSQEPSYAGHDGADSFFLPTPVLPARLPLHCSHHAYSWLLAAAKILPQYYFPFDASKEKKKKSTIF